MLTARDSFAAKAAGVSRGEDDYLTKPFCSVYELYKSIQLSSGDQDSLPQVIAISIFKH